MATSKQPSPRTLSPDTPVVSYPTPNSNDLLVVQDVDTRLPGYVQGAYGDPHPDSLTYPDLKLVYQTPLDNEANFMWVRRVYSSDRFNQEAYNYGVKYANSDPGKPIYIRTYILPREGYAPLAKNTPDPTYPNAVLVEEVVERLKDDSTDGQLDSAYLKVTRTYETIPGTSLSKKSAGSAQVIPAKFQALRKVTVFKQVVSPDEEPSLIQTSTVGDTTSSTVESTVEQVSVSRAEKTNSVLDGQKDSSLNSQKVTAQQQLATVTEKLVPSSDVSLTASALTVEGSVDDLGNGQSVVSLSEVDEVFSEQSYSSEKPLWGIPMKFKVAKPPVKQSSVSAGTVEVGDVDLGPWDMDAQSEQVTKFKKKVTTSSMEEGDVALTGSQMGMWGIETVTESLLSQSPDIEGGYKIKEISLDPLGDGRLVKKKVTYPDDPKELVEYQMDETYKILIKVTKKLVKVKDYIPPEIGANQALEVHALDAWNAVQIISEISGGLPGTETWSHTANFSFPDRLTEVGVYYQENTSNNVVEGSSNIPTGALFGGSAKSSAEAQAIIRGVPYHLVEAGYSGPCEATTTRTYSNSAPNGDIAITKIKPVMGSVVITGTGGSSKKSKYVEVASDGTLASSGGDVGGSSDVTAVCYTFGPYVHSGVGLTETGTKDISERAELSFSGSASGSGSVIAQAGISATLHLPSSSTPINSGETLVANVKVEKWRFGVWIQEVTEITRP